MPWAVDMRDFWRSTFDRVTVIRHTSYVGCRGESLDHEMRRVGLDGFVTYRWTFPTPFLPILGRHVRCDGSITCLGNLDVMVFGFYAEMRTALALGARNVLIMEDDVRLADDVGMIRKAMEALPADYDEAHLSWLIDGGRGTRPEHVLRLPRVGGSWVVSSGIFVRDSSATVFSRSGMERFVALAEASLTPFGRGLTACDVTDLPDMLRDGGRHNFLAIPLLARQEITRKRMSRRNFVPAYAPFCRDGDVGAFGGARDGLA